ncbi:hypothetical protein MTTB_09530 [Methanothermobacter tenebrarum]|uniref:Uncharacterized protein n=1 Tax=Methanothermobacter tenebrarum TaxID=680118 RepID=A0ABN6PBK0_9EURY|nr:hypothetical protein MTTB_09530 [Methanothermobacter tenebrarum]
MTLCWRQQARRMTKKSFIKKHGTGTIFQVQTLIKTPICPINKPIPYYSYIH